MMHTLLKLMLDPENTIINDLLRLLKVNVSGVNGTRKRMRELKVCKIWWGYEVAAFWLLFQAIDDIAQSQPSSYRTQQNGSCFNGKVKKP